MRRHHCRQNLQAETHSAWNSRRVVTDWSLAGATAHPAHPPTRTDTELAHALVDVMGGCWRSPGVCMPLLVAFQPALPYCRVFAGQCPWLQCLPPPGRGLKSSRDAVRCVPLRTSMRTPLSTSKWNVPSMRVARATSHAHLPPSPLPLYATSAPRTAYTRLDGIHCHGCLRYMRATCALRRNQTQYPRGVPLAIRACVRLVDNPFVNACPSANARAVLLHVHRTQPVLTHYMNRTPRVATASCDG